MRIEKVQDNTALLGNLNPGDIMINSESPNASDIQISPENIFWIEFANHKGVSLKSFDKDDRFIVYEELRTDHCWYLLPLSLYLDLMNPHQFI